MLRLTRRRPAILMSYDKHFQVVNGLRIVNFE